MTITKERIRELAEQAILRMRHSGRHLDWVELGIRLGLAEMREVAAQELESHTIHESESRSYANATRFIRDIRIEGESE